MLIQIFGWILFGIVIVGLLYLMIKCAIEGVDNPDGSGGA